MTRRLAVALGLLGVSAVADAQPRPAAHATPLSPPVGPGYVAIRVRLSDSGGGTGVGQPGIPGMGQPGGGLGQPGFPGGQPGFPGGGSGPGQPFPGGQPGFPGGQPGGQPGQPAAADAPSLIVTVPHKGLFKRLVEPTRNKNLLTNPEWVPMVRTEYGETLLLDSAPFQVYTIRTPTLADELKRKHDKEVVPATARRNELMFELIRQAVEWNQIDQALAYTKELVRWVDGAKEPTPDAPAAAPTAATRFVKAFKEIEPKLAQPLPPPADAKAWQERLENAPAVVSSAHYAIVNYGEQFATGEALNRRLDALERNFKAFYLLHALRGEALPLPDRQMLVVLAKHGTTELGKVHRLLDGGAVADDAFYSQLHNVLVLSPERTDDLSRGFLRMAKEQYKEGWSRAELVKGKAPPVDGTNTKAEDVARAMTFALVDLALEDEAIAAAVTGHGTRQLYATLGLLPQYVQLPRWVEDGLVSLLHTPRNPGVVTIAGKPTMTLGIGAGYGSPNYVLLRRFKEFQADNDFPAADVLLRRVLTDEYFAAWRDNRDLDLRQKLQLPGGLPGGMNPGVNPAGPAPGGGPGAGPRGALGSNPELAQGGRPGLPGGSGGGQPYPGGMPGMPGGDGGQPGGTIEVDHAAVMAARLEAKAHTTAWGLVHYVNASPEMRVMWEKFAKQLHRMPRDMKLDKQAVLLAFAESFNLTKAGELDSGAFKSFAEKWLSEMKSAKKSWREEKVKDEPPANNPGGMPPGGQPGGPGFPGGPGGGRPGGGPGGGR